MDLDSLKQNLYNYFSKQPVRVGNNTYGPAMTRIGRVPLNFDANETDYTGGYHPPSMLSSEHIVINPTATDAGDINATIAHEDIHSVLNNLDQQGKMEGLAKANPYYAAIAKRTAPFRGGDMPQEVPAYMGAFSNAYSSNIKPELRNLYMKYFQNQLQHADPTAAAKYQRLSSMDFNTNKMRQSSPNYMPSELADLFGDHK